MNIRPTSIQPAESNAASLHIRTAETSADWQLAHTMLDEEHLLAIAAHYEVSAQQNPSIQD
jgi:hypothetical protein